MTPGPITAEMVEAGTAGTPWSIGRCGAPRSFDFFNLFWR